jgi:hypothetical protein
LLPVGEVKVFKWLEHSILKYRINCLGHYCISADCTILAARRAKRTASAGGHNAM